MINCLIQLMVEDVYPADMAQLGKLSYHCCSKFSFYRYISLIEESLISQFYLDYHFLIISFINIHYTFILLIRGFFQNRLFSVRGGNRCGHQNKRPIR